MVVIICGRGDRNVVALQATVTWDCHPRGVVSVSLTLEAPHPVIQLFALQANSLAEGYFICFNYPVFVGSG